MSKGQSWREKGGSVGAVRRAGRGCGWGGSGEKVADPRATTKRTSQDTAWFCSPAYTWSRARHVVSARRTVTELRG